MRVEGGVQAYCAECKQHGHYVSMHYLRPAENQYWWGWSSLTGRGLRA